MNNVIRARVSPIPPEYLNRVRDEGIDALGQQVKRVVAEGGEPCRDVLRRARPGEELILASFSPFTHEGPYREFGPVFLLANPSDEDVTRDGFPSTDYFRERLVLRAYTREESIRDAELISFADVPSALERLLAHPDTAFV